jgi:hypothetical protein
MWLPPSPTRSTELINDLTERAEGFAAAGARDEADLLIELAVPWLRREAAQRRAAAARRHFLTAAHPSGGKPESKRPRTDPTPSSEGPVNARTRSSRPGRSCGSYAAALTAQATSPKRSTSFRTASCCQGEKGSL